MGAESCVCDWESPAVYRTTEHTARKQQRCSECSRAIQPGEAYRRTFGVWEGQPETFLTCQRCEALQDWVQAHVPCVCVAHGNLVEDCVETARDCAGEAPGLLFGALRRLVLIRRAPRGNP